LIICDKCAREGNIVEAKWTLRIYPAFKPNWEYAIALCDDCVVEVKKFISRELEEPSE